MVTELIEVVTIKDQDYKALFPMKKIWGVAIFLGGLLGGALILYALQLRSVSSEGTPQPAVEASVTPQPASVAALGRLEPRDKVLNLGAPSALTRARVLELRVKEGDWVTANQVIATLDTYGERRAALMEATVQVESAQARLQQVLAGAKRGEVNAQIARISELEAQLEGDLLVQDRKIARLQAEYSNAVAEYRRFQALYDDGATSESSRDVRETTMLTVRRQMQTEEETRSQRLNTGQNRIREAKATLDRIQDVRPEDVAVAQTDIERAKAAQALAKAALQNTVIQAPVAGKILRIHARSGEVIAEEGIVTLGRTDAMYVIAEVYEADIQRVAVGKKATVTSEYGGFSGELSGVVEQLGLEILNNSLYDPNPLSRSEARVVEVAVRLDDADSDRVSHLTNLQVRVLIDTD